MKPLFCWIFVIPTVKIKCFKKKCFSNQILFWNHLCLHFILSVVCSSTERVKQQKSGIIQWYTFLKYHHNKSQLWWIIQHQFGISKWIINVLINRNLYLRLSASGLVWFVPTKNNHFIYYILFCRFQLFYKNDFAVNILIFKSNLLIY